jgi:hypothetical protein
MLRVRIPTRAMYATLSDILCQLLAGGTPVSSTNKTDHHDIAEILLYVKPTSQLITERVSMDERLWFLEFTP